MRQINKILKPLLILSSILFISACSMDETIDKQIKKDEKKEEVSVNSKNEEVNEELSDSQKDIFKNSETQTAKQAVENSDKDKAIEAVKSNSASLKDPKNLDEFTNYIQREYFLYHSSEQEAAEFYKNINTYFSSRMIENLPEEDKLKIKTFEGLQSETKKYIKYDVIDYEYTKPNYNEKYGYAYSYRKYKLKNNSFIYYKLELTKENGNWKIQDDSPTTEYINMEKQFEFVERANNE